MGEPFIKELQVFRLLNAIIEDFRCDFAERKQVYGIPGIGECIYLLDWGPHNIFYNLLHQESISRTKNEMKSIIQCVFWENCLARHRSRQLKMKHLNWKARQSGGQNFCEILRHMTKKTFQNTHILEIWETADLS